MIDKQQTILAIEDDELFQNTISTCVNHRNCRIFESKGGKKGIELFDRELPDLVLLDLSLQDMNGMDVLTQISDKSPDTPVIVVTGNKHFEEIHEVLRLGVYDYFLKPLESKDILLNSVNTALERSGQLKSRNNQFLNLEKEILERSIELETLNESLRNEIDERKKTEAALIESKERFRYVVENSQDGIFILDEEFFVIYANGTCCSILGLTLDEIVGHDFSTTLDKEGLKQVVDYYNRWHKGESVQSRFECEICRKDGEKRYVELSSTITANSEGVVQTVGKILDITERRKSEEELRLSQERLTLALESLDAHVWDADYQARKIFLSDKAIDNLGYTRDEFSGNVQDVFGKFVHPDDIKSIKILLKEHLSGKTPVFTYEHRVVHKSGESFWRSSTGKVVSKDINGHPERIIGISMNIDEKKRAEISYQESQERLSMALEANDTIVWDMDVKTDSLYFSDRALSIMGYERSELPKSSRDLYDLINHPSEKERGKELVISYLKGKSPTYVNEHRIVKKSGEIFWVYSTGKAVKWDKQGLPTRMIGISIDITEKKLAEEALRESEEKYRLLVTNSPDIIMNVNRDGTILYINKVLDKIDKKSPVGRKIYDFTPKEHINYAKSKIDLVYETGRPATFEIVIDTSDGGQMWFSSRIVPIINDGVIEKLAIIHTDITERKKAEEDIMRLVSLIENASEFIGLASLDGDVLYINEAGKRLVGLDNDEEVKIKNILDFVPKDKKGNMAELRKKVLKSGSIKGEYIIQHYKTGELLNVSYNTFLCKDRKTEKPLNIAVVLRDITEKKKTEKEKKKLEEQLYHAQKMDSIGRLAGGLAHDFNNILTGILGYGELLEMKFRDPESYEGKAVRVICDGANRASKLAKQLLSFSRKDEFETEILNVNDVIRSSVKITKKIRDKIISVNCELDENLFTLEADETRLSQVFTNLIINAKDAMEDGGNLIIRTENVCLTEKDIITIPNISHGYYGKISVIDNGTGMSHEVKNQIFEPFFTTKTSGRGTGLGLSTVYGIIKKHKGHISVYSELGMGTTFTIYLPSSRKKIKDKTEENALVLGEGTILLVDDEDDIRDVETTQLENLGYDVLTAKDGNTALEIYSELHNKIDLVLLDLILPDINGGKIFLKLKQMNESVKVIILSGYGLDGRIEQILDNGARGFIQKPFKIRELSEKLSKEITGC